MSKELISALAEALPKLEGAKKNSANPHFKSKYADLGAVIDAIRPAIEHGIWFRQSTHPDENGVTVETFYIGHGAEISAGVLFMPANKRDAQAFGSALTYARRYALQTAFGLATEDDDGNAATASSAKPNPVDAEWGARPKGDGPTKTALDALVRQITHELEGCEDEATLIGYLETAEYKDAKALLEQYRPSALYGPAPSIMPEFVPLKTVVQRKVALFRMNAPEPNIMEAG